ncbi:hypothetical protein PR202_ga17215 [Eleusine coracana subsp. coracana]|uniref:Trichome birefringence-like N-terminal domain-containing protein n=1 Tax=Eleusine coracana subsp. coracana TaxID=191504 RepID=A0AAV5CPN3_ELECO|nr:hypothetical protein QOZ80_6AG0516830 [Eleusine coracana subsp. coracana]GJN00061.1 hypothetical protein PR202_ga17215 [Eleusine coracana subsp. coracana]
MKLQELKIPYSIHCVFPAAILATCLMILAVVRLHPGCTQFLPLVATSETDDGWTDSGNQSSCDIFKGEWVPDPSARKSYTTETCPVIHGHYDCMRYGRPDREFLRYRWRPDGCDLLPRFDAARFLVAMRGRSMAFVGDSLARNHMHSLVCLLSAAEQPTRWTRNASSHVYRYNHHDFTVALFWSPFLVHAAEADPDGPARSGAGLWRLHLDEPDPGWAAHVAGFDVVVISASSWFYRPAMLYEADTLVGCSGCLRPNVTDLSVRYSLRMAFRTALRGAAAAAGDGRHGRTVVVRTFSPAHYENGTGDDGATADCVRTRPLRREEKWEMNALEKEMYAIQREEFAAARREGKKGVRMMLLDATEAMAQRPDAHPSRYRLWQPDRFNVSRDCLHWCLPGAMDACNDMLQHMLLR